MSQRIELPQSATPTPSGMNAGDAGPFCPADETDVIDSSVLLAGRNALRITHRGQEYRLQVTRLGKLILTK